MSEFSSEIFRGDKVTRASWSALQCCPSPTLTRSCPLALRYSARLPAYGAGMCRVGSAHYQGCWYTHSNQEMAHCETCRLPGRLGSEAHGIKLWQFCFCNPLPISIKSEHAIVALNINKHISGHQSEIQPHNNWWQGDCWAALNKQVCWLSHKYYPCQDIQQVLLIV